LSAFAPNSREIWNATQKGSLGVEHAEDRISDEHGSTAALTETPFPLSNVSNAFKFSIKDAVYLWLPVLAILGMVIIWFQNGNFQFLGDYFVPSDPTHYLSRLSQSWDPNQDFGLPSLLTLFPTPRIALVAFYSAVFDVTGSPVVVEFSLVLTTLVLAYFGMRYFWLAMGETRLPRIGAAIAGLYFIVNPFVMLYIQNPVGILAYAMIPWCLAFTLRGLRTGKTLKYSTLVALSFTVSLITFPQVATSIVIIVAMVGIFGYEYLKAGPSRMKHLRFMISSLAAIIGLNAYWLSLSLSKASVVLAISANVQSNSPSLNSQNSILATSRLIGDWSFLSGYAGRLYVPYSIGYYSNPVTIFATSVIPFIAFSTIILVPERRSQAMIAGLAIIGIILAAGTNPPLGLLYGLLLMTPGASLFRNPPRYFLPLVALGYAVLLGCWANVFLAKSSTKKLLRKVANLGLILFLLIAICLASQPMISGDITRNWYSPNLSGYHVPSYYAAASRWFAESDPSGRILVLPSTGVYMATLWGYQGANIYPYLFANPIVTGSGGQYSFSTASGLISSVYDEFYANRTTSLGKELTLLGAAYVLFDRSVDTQFYNLPSQQITSSILGIQSDIKPVTTFGDLTIYKNLETVSVIGGSYKLNILAGSPTNPAGVLEADDFHTGWQLGPASASETTSYNGSMVFDSGQITVNVPAYGQYVFVELYKNVSIPPGAKYMIVNAQTSAPTSILLTLNTLNGEIPLLAENPPKQSYQNHYELTNQAYLIYRLDDVTSNVTSIRFAVSNRVNTSYSGNLRAEFSKIVLANQIGDLSDLTDFVQTKTFDPIIDAVTLAGFVEPTSMGRLTAINFTTTQTPDLVVRNIDPTSITIDASSAYPFVLTYFTSFDQDFEAHTNGDPFALHFEVDGSANGWLIEKTGEFTIQIRFTPQSTFLVGIGITFATLGIFLGLVLFAISFPSRFTLAFKKMEVCLSG